jgi:tRNA dimethylallyltransferase
MRAPTRIVFGNHFGGEMELTMSLIPLVAVVGPTASGKTRIAVDIALHYGGEVVSADSMQIYKGMQIGTAKPMPEEMCGVPHHMIDFVEPSRCYSVADYVDDAKLCISDIHGRGVLPILVGGTGLYVSSLIDNIKFGETVRDDGLRLELAGLAEKQGGEALIEILRGFDPQMAQILHPNNMGRIIRAIEVFKTTGVTMTEMQEKSRQTPPLYKLCIIGLCFADREVLYHRIDKRVDEMILAGLESEVRSLLDSGITRNTTAMQAIGYKEIAAAVKGEMSMDEAVETVKRETRRYAKRQMTWFRRDKRTNWLEAETSHEKNCQEAFNLIDKCLLI